MRDILKHIQINITELYILEEYEILENELYLKSQLAIIDEIYNDINSLMSSYEEMSSFSEVLKEEGLTNPVLKYAINNGYDNLLSHQGVVLSDLLKNEEDRKDITVSLNGIIANTVVSIYTYIKNLVLKLSRYIGNIINKVLGRSKTISTTCNTIEKKAKNLEAELIKKYEKAKKISEDMENDSNSDTAKIDKFKEDLKEWEEYNEKRLTLSLPEQEKAIIEKVKLTPESLENKMTFYPVLIHRLVEQENIDIEMYEEYYSYYFEDLHYNDLEFNEKGTSVVDKLPIMSNISVKKWYKELGFPDEKDGFDYMFKTIDNTLSKITSFVKYANKDDDKDLKKLENKAKSNDPEITEELNDYKEEVLERSKFLSVILLDITNTHADIGRINKKLYDTLTFDFIKDPPIFK